MMVYIRNDENTHNRFEFKSTLEIPLHFLCSTIQLVCVFTILALQITLTITRTCTFRIGIGFWSFPFLIIAPISIWIFLWKRNFIYCSIVMIIQISSNLFATAIIIISFLVIIEQIQISCSISNNYSLPLNISLIVVSAILKIVLYGEIILLYLVGHNNQKISILFATNYEIILDNPKRKTLKLLKLDLNRFDDIDV
jgi:hypothetical protein